MSMQAQAKGYLGGFLAFLTKTNAATVAIGIAVGMAVVNLVNGIMACFITPLLGLMGDKDSGKGSLEIWVFKVGEFIGVLVNFIAVMLVLYMLSKMFLKEEKKA
jgi:large-conductance mechanosensitive channel